MVADCLGTPDYYEGVLRSPNSPNSLTARQYSELISDHSQLMSEETKMEALRLSRLEQDDDDFKRPISKIEADLYYFGIRGLRQWGPKLIFRTSNDVFTPPFGPHQDTRVMQLLPVSEHDKLGKDDVWKAISTEVVKLLDQRSIKFTSIDLARFRWEEQDVGAGSEIVTTPATIWVGVLPNKLTAEIASNSSKDILRLLEEHDIHDIDVAYRESVARPLGTQLFAPVDDQDHLKEVIDPLTTALGMPIGGLQTAHLQGTMCFFFRAGDDLYGVTARHVLFPEEEGNDEYTYIAGPKKQVAVMGINAFDDFRVSIQTRIRFLRDTVSVLQQQVTFYSDTAARDGAGAVQATINLATVEGDIQRKNEAIKEVEKFYLKLENDWVNVHNRVIGHVVWAPAITASTPHGYTKDVCVIKLDMKMFGDNFRGNVIDLGTEIEGGKFISLMRLRDDAPSEFDYPADRLFRLRDILTATEMREPNKVDRNGDHTRFVIKRGLSTLSTVGRLSRFNSYQRRYTNLGTLDSTEIAIFPYNDQFGPFSRAGDSGALIADASAKFGALLTGGTGTIDSSDITYSTPMYWLWNDVIKPKYPDANLYFDIPKYFPFASSSTYN